MPKGTKAEGYSKLNYAIKTPMMTRWRAHILKVHGSQRGGAEEISEAMGEYLDKRGG